MVFDLKTVLPSTLVLQAHYSKKNLLAPSRHDERRLYLPQLIRFIVVKTIHSGLNIRFNINIIFISNYYFSVIDDVPLITRYPCCDFINVKTS
jgi:hypothetical protein